MNVGGLIKLTCGINSNFFFPKYQPANALFCQINYQANKNTN